MSHIAFRPTLVLRQSMTGTEKGKACIQCLEVCGKNLYIGGKDSVIQHCVLLDPGKPGLAVQEVKSRSLGAKGLMSQMKGLPFLNHLLILCGGSISAYHMFSLELVPTLPKINNVSSFTVDDTAVLTQSISVELFTMSSKKGVISIYRVFMDKWERLREVSLPQEPLVMAVDGTCLCMAMNKKHVLYDHKSGVTLDLFPQESSKQMAIVKAVGNGEFLLNGPGSLGMFVTRYGTSNRPPVPWPEGVLAAVAHLPYLLTLQSDGLNVYSMLDQHLKQTISMHRTKGLLSTPDGVFVFTEREVYNLSPVPPEDQIEALLQDERVDEALKLLQGVKNQLPKDAYKSLQKLVACAAGFIKFNQGCFSEAKDLLIKGAVDPREIIRLYPGFAPLGGEFKAQLPAVFNAIDLHLLSQADHPTFQRFQEFLVEFLTAVRGTAQSHSWEQEADCALLRLHVEIGDEAALIQLLSSLNHCLLSASVPYLEQHERFFALGLLYQSHGEDEKAVQTWMNIADLHTDPSNPNVYGHIVTFLSQQKSRKLVWQFADWVLQRNQEVGIQIFTETADSQETVFEDDVKFLTKYPKALLLYLEHLVNGLKSREEKQHTLLATTYTAHALRALGRGDNWDVAESTTRRKLQQFLRESPFYDSAQVKEAVVGTALHLEEAILHGRSGEHEKALQVLVKEAKDHQAAEDYCKMVSTGRSREDSQWLFLTLLKVYLASPQLVIAAVDLLNRNATAFDLVDVLQTLPSSWSLQLVGRFLSDSVRWIIHNRRMGHLEKSVIQVEHLRLKATWIRATRGMIKVERSQICQRCGRLLTEPTFLRSLKGELIHIHCRRT